MFEIILYEVIIKLCVLLVRSSLQEKDEFKIYMYMYIHCEAKDKMLCILRIPSVCSENVHLESTGSTEDFLHIFQSIFKTVLSIRVSSDSDKVL